LKVSSTLLSGSLDTLTAPANGSFTCMTTKIVRNNEGECGDHGGVCPRVFNTEEVGKPDRNNGTANEQNQEQGVYSALASRKRK
jgi:hypothetical protein